MNRTVLPLIILMAPLMGCDFGGSNAPEPERYVFIASEPKTFVGLNAAVGTDGQCDIHFDYQTFDAGQHILLLRTDIDRSATTAAVTLTRFFQDRGAEVILVESSPKYSGPDYGPTQSWTGTMPPGDPFAATRDILLSDNYTLKLRVGTARLSVDNPSVATASLFEGFEAYATICPNGLSVYERTYDLTGSSKRFPIDHEVLGTEGGWPVIRVASALTYNESYREPFRGELEILN
jgi:hypothetical protein